jgi:hypothetical protein
VREYGSAASFSAKDVSGLILVTVLGMVAEMERKFIRERQQAGVCRNSAAGFFSLVWSPDYQPDRRSGKSTRIPRWRGQLGPDHLRQRVVVMRFRAGDR